MLSQPERWILARRNNIAELLIVATAWSIAAAITLLAMRDYGGITLIWLPSGIATSALFGMPYRRWPRMLAVIGLCSVSIYLSFEFTLAKTFGYTAGGLICASSAAFLARLSLTRRRLDNLHMYDFTMLFLSAAVGSLGSTIVASLFWDEFSLLLLGWWILVNWLGIMLMSPTVIAIRAKYHWNRRARLVTMRLELSLSLFALFMVSGMVSWWALHGPALPILFLVAVVVVLASSWHGQLGATVTLFAFALAGTMTSILPSDTMILASLPRLDRALALQAFMAVMLIVGFHLARRLMEYDRLSSSLADRNRILDQNNKMFALAEHLSGVGRWQYFPKTNRQVWSEELCRMHGLPAHCQPDRDAREALYPDGAEGLSVSLRHHETSREPYRIELDVQMPTGETRVMCMLAQNDFAPDGSLQETFAVVRDVTDHYREVERLAQEKGLALQQAEEAHQLALTDPLTGLPNRRRAMSEIDRAIMKFARAGEPLSLIVFDLDHFKSVNDTHGHQAGDEVLVRVGQIAKAQCRTGDLVGRIGGEEFIWVLPAANSATARAAAERLRHAIEHHSAAGAIPGVTASVGYASWSMGDSSLTLFARADAALYDAKNSGRNVIKMAA